MNTAICQQGKDCAVTKDPSVTDAVPQQPRKDASHELQHVAAGLYHRARSTAGIPGTQSGG